MAKARTNPKNPLGLTTAEILRHYFHRAQAKRLRAEPQIRAERDARSERTHLRRLDHQEGTEAFTLRRIRLLEKYPSASAVRQLADMVRDPATPESCRVKASRLILRLANYGDEPSPGLPRSEDTPDAPAGPL